MSKASLGAALSSLGQNIPGIFESVMGAYRSGMDRKEASKDRELNRELMGYKLESAKQEKEQGALNLEDSRIKAEIAKQARKAVDYFYNKFGSKEKADAQMTQIDNQIAGMSVKELRMLGGAEGAKNLFTGLFDKKVGEAPKPTEQDLAKVARYQFVSPEAQGILAQYSKGIKREQEQADIQSQREYETGKMATSQAFQEQQQQRLFEQQKALEGMRAQGREDLQSQKTAALAAKTAGGRDIPATQATALGGTISAISQLDTMMGSIGDVNLQFGPSDKLRTLNPWDTTAKGINQLSFATKQLIGKGLEGGVLRKEDEEKYDKIIPKLGDTKDVLQKKYEQLREMLSTKYSGELTGLSSAGFNTSGFSPVKTSNIDITKQNSEVKAPGQEDEFDTLWSSIK